MGNAARLSVHRIVWGLICAALTVVLVGIPAVSAEPSLQKSGTLDVALPDGAIDGVTANRYLMFDAPNRRAYQLFTMEDFSIRMRAFDLDARKLIGEESYPFGSMGAGPAAPNDLKSGPWVHAIDHESGILYVGYRDPNTSNFGGVVAIDGKTLEILHDFPREPLTLGIDPDNPGCLSSSCQPQAPQVTPLLRGMSFVRPELSGGPPKLLLIINEFTPPLAERNNGIMYIAQWDAESGRQDFMYQIRACSNSRLHPGLEYPIGVFYARLTSGIYVACITSGGTGLVVRVELDLNGRPTNESAFPGPLSMTDAIPDADADRMLLRVRNEEGESWWVFDGVASAYTGVIGITLRGATTAAGVDPTIGRLYAVAPPTQSANQSHPGGVLVSDIRRAPAPQALRFPEFAQSAKGPILVDPSHPSGDRFLYFLPPDGSVYTVLRDNMTPTFDPAVSDLDALTVNEEERQGVTGRNFTGSGHAWGLRTLFVGGLVGTPPTGPDVSGFRLGRLLPTMAGSPCGPGNREFVLGDVKRASLSNNLSSAAATVAQADSGTLQDLGQPSSRCYPRPTDISQRDTWDQVVGLMRSVNPELADEFEEYPRPLDTELDDETTEDEGMTDLDELAGTQWPFATVECAGDAEDDTITSPKPLDRGDAETGPIPKDLRAQQLDLDRLTASVACSQENAYVSARAQIQATEQTPAFEVDVPELGTISIAEVSSDVHLYLDPERGLVSRAIATARGIQIGDHITIEAAETVAEAWAAGRPGTASTKFERRICGVRVKDEAPDQHVYQPSVDQDDLLAGNIENAIDPEGGGEQRKNVNQQVCGDPDQPALGTLKTYTGVNDQQPLIDVINRALGSRGIASAPPPDAALRQGTPGGYLASLQKDRLEEISSRSVNNDASTQVPALQIVIFNDDSTKGRGRQIYQFAGVDASVTYGIYLLNPDEFFDDLPDLIRDMTDPLPPPVFDDPNGDLSDADIAPPPAGGPITILFEGLNFLLRSPKDALLAAAVWALLFAPVQLSMRRRALKGTSP